MKNKQQPHTTPAFTLMETLLAVALVGMLISVFITVFVPVRGMIQQALTKQDAERIVSTLRAELNTLRENETSKYASSFEKGFDWVLASRNPTTSLVIFTYRADTTKLRREDGTYPPIPVNKSRPGQDSLVTTVVCPMNNSLHRNDIQHAVGSVYLVRLTQLIPDGDRYRSTDTPGTIVGASSPDDYYSKDEKDPWGGTIFCRADFYIMTPPNPARYKSRSWSRVGRPVFSANISFHR